MAAIIGRVVSTTNNQADIQREYSPASLHSSPKINENSHGPKAIIMRYGIHPTAANDAHALISISLPLLPW